MQMARSGNVFKSISLLCRIFEDIGAPKSSPETFRMAKFNDTKAIYPMWTVLGYLVTILDIFNREQLPLLSKRPGNQLWDRTQRVDVIITLYRYGYRRSSFYCDVDRTCSRELLFAFAWLLYKSSFFDIVRHAHIAVINNEGLLNEIHRPAFLSNERESNIKQIVSHGTTLSSFSIQDQNVNSLLCYHQKVFNASRTALSSELASVQYAHSLHKYTFNAAKLTVDLDNIVAKPHLSVVDVALLRHPKILEEHMKKLEICIQGLVNLLEWKRVHEGVFWEWIDSALDLSLSEDSGEGVTRETNLPEFELPSIEKASREAIQCWSNTKDVYSQLQTRTTTAKSSLPPSTGEFLPCCSIPDVMYVPQNLLKGLPEEKYYHVAHLTSDLSQQVESLRKEVETLRQKAQMRLDDLCSLFIPTFIACTQKQFLSK